MSSFFTTYLTDPIYNLLVFFVGVVPGGDIGLAVIAVTLIVKLATLPLSLSMIRTQRAMKAIEPQFKEIKEKFKNDKEKQAKEIFALYRQYRINPFSSILLVIIQIPILFALYWVFVGESLPQVDAGILYSFVSIPTVITTDFLGIFPLAGTSLILALLAGVAQYAQGWLSMPIPAATGNKSLAEDFGRAMALQVRYVIPVLIAFAAYATSGAVALYFITSSVFAVLQELLVRRTGVRGSTLSTPV